MGNDELNLNSMPKRVTGSKNENEVEEVFTTNVKPHAKRHVAFLRKYPLFVVTVLLAVALVISLVWRNSDPQIAVPLDLSVLSEEEQAEIRTEVLEVLSDIMILPEDVTPVLATVADSETLRAEQAFYAKVEDGDILLVFQISQQAVIYRPSEHKIVNAGSLVVN